MERFLQMCAGENIQVVNCTTPANYFHVLRRQMHREFRKPLIIMTPKSLLRNRRCVSKLVDFSRKNSFHRILNDDSYLTGKSLLKLSKDNNIEKVIMCSGKIYYDLLEVTEKNKNDKVVSLELNNYILFHKLWPEQ